MRLDRSFYRATILSSMAVWATYLVSVFYRRPISTSVYIHVWVLLQGLMLILPGWLFAGFLAKRYPRFGWTVGCGWIVGIPMLVLCDAIVYSWMSDHLLSARMYRVTTDLRGSLIAHAPLRSVVATLQKLIVFFLLAAMGYWVSGWIARSSYLCHLRLSRLRRSLVVASVTMFFAAMFLTTAFYWRPISKHMRSSPSLHPFCAAGLFRDSRNAVSKDAAIDLPARMGTLFRQDQEHRLKWAGLDFDQVLQRSDRPTDVLIVVIESLRRECLDELVMPNLHELSSVGVLCKNHFSGGNASSHGMFSLVSGLEAIWFERPVRFRPLMNRLFRQSGYRLGLFSNQDDWRLFYMDAFLNSEQYDRYECEPKDWVDGDRRTVARAMKFLDGDRATDAKTPRLAVVYLYSTHADYRSDVVDRIFQPAADDDFPIPYSIDDRKAVWNRYCNSAHTVDRLIKPLLRRDRIIIVTGDHGESFLEDGTCGHGTRLSEFQNMTPAVLYAPGIRPLTITHPTMHADLLPTLVDLADLPMVGESPFDGVNLMDEAQRHDRVFVTRDYMTNEVCLIGPWTINPSEPFGYRCEVDRGSGTIELTEPILPNGDRAVGR
ncbi:Sulfatase [Novipirellula aureliae]|uniref:Sulfatase n=1 Tax=Novipirellula aureliae TaxID=2527966 RepID=A0A5C6EEA8_9BACT|nr:sulfatase-like hydrolase/transferase [Novipirellula aureliae]TWU45559.1 Sulfatase [Novipirellula aureliae]